MSRGDDSGTHKKELAIWRMAGIDAARSSGQWYREAGAGMVLGIVSTVLLALGLLAGVLVVGLLVVGASTA